MTDYEDERFRIADSNDGSEFDKWDFCDEYAPRAAASGRVDALLARIALWPQQYRVRVAILAAENDLVGLLDAHDWEHSLAAEVLWLGVCREWPLRAVLEHPRCHDVLMGPLLHVPDDNDAEPKFYRLIHNLLVEAFDSRPANLEALLATAAARPLPGERPEVLFEYVCDQLHAPDRLLVLLNCEWLDPAANNHKGAKIVCWSYGDDWPSIQAMLTLHPHIDINRLIAPIASCGSRHCIAELLQHYAAAVDWEYVNTAVIRKVVGAKHAGSGLATLVATGRVDFAKLRLDDLYEHVGRNMAHQLCSYSNVSNDVAVEAVRRSRQCWACEGGRPPTEAALQSLRDRGVAEDVIESCSIMSYPTLCDCASPVL